MNTNKKSKQILFYFLHNIFFLLKKLFFALVVGLFCIFVLNGGAAGSSEMNEISTIFSVIYIVILVPVFLPVIKRLFPRGKEISEFDVEQSLFSSSKDNSEQNKIIERENRIVKHLKKELNREPTKKEIEKAKWNGIEL